MVAEKIKKIRLSEKDRYGGKSEGMERLAKALPLLSQNLEEEGIDKVSLKVPPSICIPVEACRKFVVENGMLEPISEIYKDMKSDPTMADSAVEAGFLAKRNSMDKVPGLVEQLTEAYSDPRFKDAKALAVRSSAVGEDSSDPMAGILETVITRNDGLESVLRAIRLVWSSYFKSDARSYVGEDVIKTPGVGGIGVLIQPVVGEVFTLNDNEYIAPHVAGQVSTIDMYAKDIFNPIATLVLGHGSAVVDVAFVPSKLVLANGKLKGEAVLKAKQNQMTAVDLSTRGGFDALVTILLIGNKEELLSQMPGMSFAFLWRSPLDRTLYDRPGFGGQERIPEVNLSKRLAQLGVFKAMTSVLENLKTLMGTEVDKEIAMIGRGVGNRIEGVDLYLLQARPEAQIDTNKLIRIPEEEGVFECVSFVGHGKKEIKKIVIVDENADTRGDRLSRAITKINENAEDDVLLVVPGNAGSCNWENGVRITFGQISRMGAIVETELRGRVFAPSNGGHFPRAQSKGIYFGSIAGKNDEGRERGNFNAAVLKNYGDVKVVDDEVIVVELHKPATLYANKNPAFGPVRMSLQFEE